MDSQSKSTIDRQTSGFYSENYSNTGFEPWIVKHICEPLVKRIPPTVHPNTISIFNHAVCWLVFVAAAVAPYLNPIHGMAARVVAGIGVFSSLVLDCLDGMHARRTGQTSKLGEVMDHWLDALNVPLMGAAMILTLSLDPWTTAFGIVTASACYNAQLVLYHHTHRFVHPTTSGVDGQVYLTAVYLFLAGFFYFFPQDLRWVLLSSTVFAWLVIFISIKMDLFFIRRLGGFLPNHLVYLLFCTLFSALYLVGMMNTVVYVVGITMISFRLTGSYVLYTVLRKPYSGSDWWVGLWILAILAGHYWLEPYQIRGIEVQSVIPYLFFLTVVSLNLWDLARYLPELRYSRSRKAAPADSTNQDSR
ncbi:MAG: CDP-alcohol phosphatidyltransferase family protein [Bradymonadales bacterium]|nr:CDP-alcohol phosphatidyltransferase family protein [Bradymonadales bacterium]